MYVSDAIMNQIVWIPVRKINDTSVTKLAWLDDWTEALDNGRFIDIIYIYIYIYKYI